MATLTTKPITLKAAKTHRHPDGTIHALSSDGATVYTVRLDPTSCTCPAGASGRACYHVRTAKVRYRKPVAAYGDELIAFLTGTGAYTPTTDPEPEPPAPAATRPCQASLYPDCDCPRCQPVALAVA